MGPWARGMVLPAREIPRLTAIERGDHLYLIDGSGYIFRAYHALPPLTRKSDGLPVGAVHGFCAMLHKLLRELPGGVRPTHLAVIFDKSEVSFRNEMFDGYKANRPAPPSDLIPQFAVIRQAVRAFSVPCIEQGGYEADDLIATYARQAVEQGATVRIVSSDKDLMQLVSDGIKLYDTMKDRDIGEPEVLEKFGVPPSKVGDVLALAGDSVDNVPGVPGIGVKTGAKLLQDFKTLENLLAGRPNPSHDRGRSGGQRPAGRVDLERDAEGAGEVVPAPAGQYAQRAARVGQHPGDRTDQPVAAERHRHLSGAGGGTGQLDRKSTRLNSSH